LETPENVEFHHQKTHKNVQLYLSKYKFLSYTKNMIRKIYNDLLYWKKSGSKKPLLVIGARQIGKTFIIEEFIQNEFSESITFNLFNRPDICAIFAENIPVPEKLLKMELLIGKKIDFENTLIFFDEVQHSEDIIAALKYFAEDSTNYKIICAGSLLGVKINRLSKPFPVGKVEMLKMYPMDFEEFLWANDETGLTEEISICYEKNKNMSEPLHEKCLKLYRTFLCSGGMPEAVADIIKNNNDVLLFNSSILSNIRIAYLADMTKYVISKAESIKIEAVYNSIPTQLGNKSNKFQYSEIKKGARSRDYSTALEWLVSSGMIYLCDAVTALQMPLKGYIRNDFFKIFLNDTGILCNHLGIRLSEIMLDNDFYYKGIITENYAAAQFVSGGIPLYYWRNENSQELDFLLDTQDGIIPIEVKSGKNKVSPSLSYYCSMYKSPYAIKIRKGNFGFTDKIRNVPLYAVFCCTRQYGQAK